MVPRCEYTGDLGHPADAPSARKPVLRECNGPDRGTVPIQNGGTACVLFKPPVLLNVMLE